MIILEIPAQGCFETFCVGSASQGETLHGRRCACVGVSGYMRWETQDLTGWGKFSEGVCACLGVCAPCH